MEDRRNGEATVMCWSRAKWLSLAASVTEQARYVKAFFIGQGKKLRARSEQEAAEADLTAAKMQVEAADAAEETKKRLHQSNPM